jgi:hypothetical protein
MDVFGALYAKLGGKIARNKAGQTDIGKAVPNWDVLGGYT